MWCDYCHRVFDDAESDTCPVCRVGRLHRSAEIKCPICNSPMEVGYLSFIVKLTWRHKFSEGAPPDEVISDDNNSAKITRRVTYYCKLCRNFYIIDAKSGSEYNKIVTKEKPSKVSLLCPQCGRELVPGAKYCPFCGYKYGESSSKNLSRFKVSEQKHL